MPHDAFCFDSQMNKLMFYDDFLGRTLLDEWLLTVVATGAGALVDGLDGGVYRLRAPTNVTNDTAILDWNDLRSLTVVKKVVFEARIRINSVANMEMFILLRYDGNNQCSIRYSTVVPDVNWKIYTISGGVMTFQDSGITSDTSWHIFRIEAHIHGGNHIHFYIDGVETANSPISTNVPTSYFQPRFRVNTLAVAEKQLDIDYVVIVQDR